MPPRSHTALLDTPMPAERIPWHLLRYEHVLEIKAALE